MSRAFRAVAVLLPVTILGCAGDATIGSDSQGSNDDALTNGVVVQLPQALGGGTQRTHFSASTEPAVQHAYGVPSPVDGAEWPGAWPETDARATSSLLPGGVDLSGWAPPAGNQGPTGSCQSWSTGYSAMGWWANYAGVTHAQFAPMFLYSQIVKGNCSRGAWPEVPLSILQSQGIDTVTHYEPNQWNLDCATQPSTAAVANAARFKITGYTKANLSGGVQQAIMQVLASNKPAILSILTYPEFDNANPSNLLVGPPKAGDKMRGGHAIAAFAYDANGVWILNSWGTGWGGNGWAELSWAFVNGSFNGAANVADVASIDGVSFTAPDYNQYCPYWAATGQCQVNPGYMLENCAQSCANPAPCDQGARSCGSVTFNFEPFVNAKSCLDVYEDSSVNLTQIEEYTCNQGGAQKFTLVDQGNGKVSLRHVDSGKCVDVYRAGTADGTRVELYPCNNTVAQQFEMLPRYAGAVTFYNANSGKCLDVAGANPADLTPVQLWDCNNTNAQKWWMNAQ